jgi:hypothetical protein
MIAHREAEGGHRCLIGCLAAISTAASLAATITAASIAASIAIHRLKKSSVALGCNQHASVAISMCLHSQRPPKAAVAEDAALAAALAESESASSPRPALTAPIQDAYTARPDRCVEWAPCTEAKSVPPSRDCTEKYSQIKGRGRERGNFYGVGRVAST